MTSYSKLKGQNITNYYYTQIFIFSCFMPKRGKIFGKCFKTEKGTFKKEKMQDEYFMWLGRESVAECGSDEINR